MMLSDVCLSVTYSGPKSRTERPWKTKIGTEIAHVTRDSDTTFTVRRSKVNLQGAGHIVGAYCDGLPLAVCLLRRCGIGTVCRVSETAQCRVLFSDA